MSIEEKPTQSNPKQPSHEGPLQCALTGREVSSDEAYWAPPLITTWELISTIFTTLFQTPANLGHVLFAQQDDVPYHPEAREELAARRTTEQLKLLLVLLFIAALIAVPILFVFR